MFAAGSPCEQGYLSIIPMKRLTWTLVTSKEAFPDASLAVRGKKESFRACTAPPPPAMQCILRCVLIPRGLHSQNACFTRLKAIVEEEQHVMQTIRSAGVRVIRQPQLESDPTVFCIKCSREVRCAHRPLQRRRTIQRQ